MSLDGLVIEDFRSSREPIWSWTPRCNLISGANASGKTSLLEAIFVLGRGRSFSNRSYRDPDPQWDRGLHAGG